MWKHPLRQLACTERENMARKNGKYKTNKILVSLFLCLIIMVFFSLPAFATFIEDHKFYFDNARTNVLKIYNADTDVVVADGGEIVVGETNDYKNTAELRLNSNTQGKKIINIKHNGKLYNDDKSLSIDYKMKGLATDTGKSHTINAGSDGTTISFELTASNLNSDEFILIILQVLIDRTQYEAALAGTYKDTVTITMEGQ